MQGTYFVLKYLMDGHRFKAYPKTKFIGHADAFWANVSADYANESYPSSRIKS